MSTDSAAMTSRPGVELIATFPEGTTVVGIVNFKDQVIVATSNGVYELVDDGVYGHTKVLKLIEMEVTA